MGLLSIYFIAIFGSSLLGGSLSSRLRLSNNQLRLAMGVIAGFIVGIAIHHLFPDALEYIGADNTFHWVIAGILTTVLFFQISSFHGHVPVSSERDNALSINPNSWMGIIFGMLIHSVIEGAILGGTIQNASQQNSVLPERFGIFLVILFHKPFDAAAIVGVMRASKISLFTQKLFITLFSLVTPLAMVVAHFGGEFLIQSGYKQISGCILAFSSGMFMCIALGDFLPELMHHRESQRKAFCTFLIGIVLSYIFLYFE